MSALLALLFAPLILLTAAFAVEVLVGLRPLPVSGARAFTDATAVIIVPAHNEEAILGERLAALGEAARDYASVLLVADNCTDLTAQIARSLGVEVIERCDAERRGKGFALDFARRHLQSTPPDVVVVIDADCWTDAQSIENLISLAVVTERPWQSTYLLAPNRDRSPAVELSSFAFYIKNVVRQRGLQRLAGRAHLLGTGMAFPWSIFDRADLATGDIVEDLKLGQELADLGHAPLFTQQAIVWSNVETEKNTLSQRRRWEGGVLKNAVRAGPGFLIRSLGRRDAKGIWAAINVMTPPFAFLILLDLAALIVGIAAIWLTGSASWPLVLLVGTLTLAAAGLAIAWRTGGSRFVSLAGLASIPRYLVWKLGLYLGFARGGTPKEWVRTSRDEI